VLAARNAAVAPRPAGFFAGNRAPLSRVGANPAARPARCIVGFGSVLHRGCPSAPHDVAVCTHHSHFPLCSASVSRPAPLTKTVHRDRFSREELGVVILKCKNGGAVRPWIQMFDPYARSSGVGGGIVGEKERSFPSPSAPEQSGPAPVSHDFPPSPPRKSPSMRFT